VTKTANRAIFGYIYRIYNESILHKNKAGEIIQPCYIGKTEETVEKRFQGHQRDSRKVRGSKSGGDGKLHSEMWAKNCLGFRVEMLAEGFSPADLSEKEAFFIKQFDSIENGWNKISASIATEKRGEKVLIVIDGVEQGFESVAHLCRKLNISNTSLTHWLKKRRLSLSEAVVEAINGKERELAKQDQTVEVFKRRYSSYSELVRDAKVNKHGLSALTIRRRVTSGMSIEDAMTKPKEKKKASLALSLPSGESKLFLSVQEAHKFLTAQKLTLVPYQTVISYLNKGQTPEQAFGLSKRPWELKYIDCDLLVSQNGYEYVGEKSPFSEQPVIDDLEKKIYTTVKLFANTFGLDYSNITKKIKAGWTVEQILKKSKHRL
jgi:hypothetical protein